MKLKCRPEDFQVEELTEFKPTGGIFAWYRLTKRSLGTPEAIGAIVKHWKLHRKQVSFGGLKDKHALTVQYVTIARGPHRDLRQEAFELQYLGQADREFTPHDISGNRFRIVLRDLLPAEVAPMQQALLEVAQDGVPNYFDDQRFGSVGVSGTFIAQPWCQGNYERALWLALVERNEHDRPGDKHEKALLERLWGDWATLKAEMKPSSKRSIVTYLVDHPDDYRGAIARLNIDLRGLYLSAFQSAVWNRLLAAWLKRHCRPEQLLPVSLKLGPVPFPQALEPEQRQVLRDLELPLPAARNKPEPGEMLDLATEALTDFGLELRELRVKYPRDSFFSKGDRKAMMSVAGLTQQAAEDDMYNGRQKIRLQFDLPRGAYATMLVKRITECLPGKAELPALDLDLDLGEGQPAEVV